MATATQANKWEQAAVIIEDYKANPTSPIMLLQDLQAAYNYVPAEAMELATRELGIPLEQLYGLATFYKAFSLEERGKHNIKVCKGTACVVRGAADILDGFLRELGLPRPGTTGDKMVTLEVVNCVGACAIGPIAILDGEYHGHLDQSIVKDRVESLRAEDEEARK
ncbi:MAG: NAD(P)H-dependent oxidoreductase subunit E [candidate division Zixibacteria bacterium]|nr:NAD(P)H-dependent oxidoreductase subunit E [candidate division Zixibacteria bacterium]